ncbi:MAG: metallophosphoesterase [Deltaproteobacteria bacterium]|nr:metallophosphoesterase [Deltaproteobacteria bacterium]
MSYAHCVVGRRLACALALAVPVGSLLALARPALGELVVGPHLQDVRTDGATIVWEQAKPGPGVVEVDGKPWPTKGDGPLQEVELTGLAAGKIFGYSVKADGAEETGSLTTAPANPLASYVLVVMGDNRSNADAHQSVVDAVRAEGPALVVNTGDMVADGAVGTNWKTFFQIEHELVKGTPWYPTVGNHEADGDKLPHFYTDYLAPPSAESASEAYYSFRYANAAFLVLDGQTSTKEEMLGLWTNLSDAQLGWLDAALAGYAADPKIQHLFVVTHEPPYSSKPGRTGSHALRLLHPKFAQHGVDAILCGHDHYLERGESPEGLRYYIVGGGGAPLYTNSSEGKLGPKSPTALPWLDDAHSVHFAKKSLGYLLLRIENGQVDAQVKDPAGAILDQTSWNTGDIAGGGGGGSGAAGHGGSGAAAGPGAGGTGGAAAQGGNPAAGGASAPGVGPPESEQDAGCSCRLATPGRGPARGLLWLLLAACAAARDARRSEARLRS